MLQNHYIYMWLASSVDFCASNILYWYFIPNDNDIIIFGHINWSNKPDENICPDDRVTYDIVPVLSRSGSQQPRTLNSSKSNVYNFAVDEKWFNVFPNNLKKLCLTKSSFFFFVLRTMPLNINFFYSLDSKWHCNLSWSFYAVKFEFNSYATR